MYYEKNVLGYLRNVEYYSFQTFAIVFSTPNILLVGYFADLEMKVTLSTKMCFEKMPKGISEMVNARAFKPLPLCSAPLKTY